MANVIPRYHPNNFIAHNSLTWAKSRLWGKGTAHCLAMQGAVACVAFHYSRVTVQCY